MKSIRMTIAVGVLVGLSLGCSKKDTPSVPEFVPGTENQKPLELKPPDGGFKMKSRGPVKTSG
jgi:hypothetical protein